MADIKNKNELKRRIDLFLDDFSHEEYMINEPFCKETMRMMREFVGHASHLLDCADAKIKKAKRTARNKAIDEFAERMSLEISESIIGGMLFDNRDNSSYDTADKIVDYVIDTSKKIAEQLKGGAKQ